MKKIKKLVFLTIFILIFLYFFPFFNFLNALEAKGQNWKCLNWENYNGGIKPDGKEDHRIRLRGTEIPTNRDVYIVVMIEADGFKFTTGNDAYDNELGFGNNNYTQLNTTYTNILPLTFVVDGGSKRKFTNGQIDLVARSHTKGATNHRFFAVWIIDNLTQTGGARTISYGTFKINEDVTKCSRVHWDPLGRIFDIKSLEPIPGIEIEILNYETGERTPIPRNPQTTLEDGMYNFLVEKGRYKLKINKTPVGYSFATDTSKIDPNYIKAYAGQEEKCEKRADTSGQQKTICAKLLISPNEEVKENPPIITQRDIPLDPGNNPPYRAKEVISFHYGSIRGLKTTLFEGRVSHPLAQIKLKTNLSNQLIGETQADNFGLWQIEINNEKLPDNENIVANFEKVDLTQLANKNKKIDLFKIDLFVRQIIDFILKKSSAQEPLTKNNQVVFTPIFSYLDGYAYDSQGKIISNAVVLIKLKGTTGVYYQTKADEKGYFQIDRDFLPPFEYYLEFRNPLSNQILSSQSTSEFAEKNKDYLVNNEINLMMATKKGKNIFPSPKTATKSSFIISPTKSIDNSKMEVNKKETPKSPDSELTNISNNSTNQKKTTFILMILLVVLIIIGGLLVFLFFKKRTSSNTLAE